MICIRRSMAPWLRPQKQGRPPPPEQQILKCWGASQCKAACALCNLLFQQLWGTKLQRVCREPTDKRLSNSLHESPTTPPCSQLLGLRTTETKDCPTYYVRVQLHLPTTETKDCPTHYVRVQLHLPTTETKDCPTHSVRVQLHLPTTETRLSNSLRESPTPPPYNRDKRLSNSLSESPAPPPYNRNKTVQLTT